MEKRPDESIKKDVIDELYWDGRIDASKIEVRVKNGKVNLEGSVISRPVKAFAYLDAWQVKGVKFVLDKLEVKLPKGVARPSDVEVKDRVEEFLDWEPKINGNIEISVKNGVVHLGGTTDMFWKKAQAETVASKANGVLDIVNEIAVAPEGNIIDQEIAKGILDSIKRKGNIDVDNLAVKVEEGKVTLEGRVPNYDAFSYVENTAIKSAGVIEIENNLLIV